MESLPKSNSDRRDFFRINDMVYIDITVLDYDDISQAESTIKNPPLTDKNNQTKRQLNTIQASLTNLIENINPTDRQVARALRLLDDKINIIFHLVQRKQKTTDNRNMIESNLSGGGIAFMTGHQYAPKTTLELSIELQPSGTVINAIANVVDCNESDIAHKETPYHLRLIFTHMNEYDRNFLVKHTLSRQAEILRMAQK